MTIFLCTAGCGGKGSPVGEVAGTVTFQGKPVGEGRVTFNHTQLPAVDEALLKSDGTFAIKAPMPVGEYKVMVMPLVDQKQEGGKGPVVGFERPAPNITEKYRAIGSTDLKATVKEGKNDIKLDMKR